MTDEQIKHLVERFLAWPLPNDFTPDCGISFDRGGQYYGPWLVLNKPSGTNLLNASQAEAMVRHMLEDLPASTPALSVVPQSASRMEMMESAPKDGTMVFLLVDYSGEEGCNPLEDQTVAWTIGFNNEKESGDDEWQFAGWSWHQDIFCQGSGRVIAWSPLNFPLPILSDEACARLTGEGGAA